MDAHVRHKSIRLRGYDYTTEGMYFVTICAINRELLFGRIEGESMIVNDIGRLVEESWFDIPNHHAHVALDLHTCMPNHFHGVIVISDGSSGMHVGDKSPDRARQGRAATIEAFGKPIAGSLPTIIRSFKSASSRRVNRYLGREGESIWQRNYYEHVIRTEDALCRVREYILNNPLKWALDPENPEVGKPSFREI